jgi:hypothetical protein
MDFQKKRYYTKREFVSGETHKLERAMKFKKKRIGIKT